MHLLIGFYNEILCCTLFKNDRTETRERFEVIALALRRRRLEYFVLIHSKTVKEINMWTFAALPFDRLLFTMTTKRNNNETYRQSDIQLNIWQTTERCAMQTIVI